MAPKTGSPRGKKKNIQVAATKPVEKNKTGRWLMNLALGSPSHNLAPGSHRKKQVSRSIKAKVHFPIDRIRRYLKEGRYSQRIGFGAPVYLVAVLEYLITEVLELTEQAMKDIKNISIIPRHVMLGIMRDEELSKLLVGVTIVHSGVLPNIHESLLGDGTVEDAAKLPTKDAARLLEKTTESR